jgi:Glyoxalase-like domain
MTRFWGAARDWTLHEVTDDHAVLRSAKGVGPYVEFLRTPGVRTVWNRVRLDLMPYPGDDQATEARLGALGATSDGYRPDLDDTVAFVTEGSR